MHSTLSPFQTLPPHVAELVINQVASRRAEYVVGRKPSTDDKHSAELLLPLVWVCRTFRTLVLERFCKTYELQLNGHMNTVSGMPSSWPRCLQMSGYPVHLLARQVHIRLNLVSIHSGEALKQLSRAPCGGFTFPRARKLVIESNHTHKSYSKPKVMQRELARNTDAFIARIWQMAYAASDILVRVNSSLDSSAQADIECFGSLLTQLYQFGTNIEYVSRGSVALANLKVDAISNLVRVAYYDPDANRDQLTQLVRVNSSTLQYLDISSLDLAAFTDLVKCEDGDYTTYPCLHDLELDLKTRWDISNTPVFEGVVPFPKLRRLYIVRAYPFGDDTLFRGNAGTLEHLQFQPTSQAVDMLRQHGVFRPASHPNLYSVKIDCGHFRTEELPGSDMHLDYMLSIAPKATVWNMPDCVRDDSMCSILGLLGTHTNLQHLFLPSMVLGLTDVVTLIKSLPLLSDLYVDYPRLDVVPDGVPSDELPSYMISTYAPMGERFRSWHCACFYKWRASDEEIAKCILLLALVCPNFNKASVSSDAQKALMDAMRKAVNSAGFERHAWQLRHMHLDRLDMAKC